MVQRYVVSQERCATIVTEERRSQNQVATAKQIQCKTRNEYKQREIPITTILYLVSADCVWQKYLYLLRYWW